MSVENITKAAQTLMSMCTSFLMGGITVETFVSNLETFAERCREELPAPEGKEGENGE